MNEEYRRRIQKEKGNLSESEIFTSPQYLKLLRSIAKEITDGEFDHVMLSQKPRAEYMGWCDGNGIEINLLNEVTQSFLNKELKNESIVGVLGHECGHYNFTNFVLSDRYFTGFMLGIWYPHSPAPDTEQEAESLEQIKGYFQEKNKAVLRFIKETAGVIWNLLEDVYIEEEMCRKYPGSIRRGILQNRSRNGEWLPSLREQIHMGYPELSIMINLIIQYTLSGTINNWDGYTGKLSERLEEIKPIIEKAVKESGESARFVAANQILLKIWDLLFQMIQEAEEALNEQQEKEHSDQKGEKPETSEGEKGQQASSGEDEMLQDTIQKFLSQVPKFLQAEKSGKCGKNQGNPTDEEWDGRWRNTEDLSQEPRAEENEQKDTQTEAEQEKKQAVIKRIEADEDFWSLLSELARKK